MNVAVSNRRDQDALKGKLILDWLLFGPRVNLAEEQALFAAANEPDSVPDPLTALVERSDASPAELTARQAFVQSIEDAISPLIVAPQGRMSKPC